MPIQAQSLSNSASDDPAADDNDFGHIEKDRLPLTPKHLFDMIVSPPLLPCVLTSEVQEKDAGTQPRYGN